jgi:hypothetical protein
VTVRFDPDVSGFAFRICQFDRALVRLANTQHSTRLISPERATQAVSGEFQRPGGLYFLLLRFFFFFKRSVTSTFTSSTFMSSSRSTSRLFYFSGGRLG